MLTDEKTEACDADRARLSAAEVAELLPSVAGWSVVERDGIERLERAFPFPNFVTALAFTNHVGDLAESNSHHPAILTEWGKTTVTWWTHSVKGLHRNDFIMAAKTDALLK